MRSLSEVIKSSRVLLDKEPKVLKIDIEPKTKAVPKPESNPIEDESNPIEDVEAILEKNAKESAEIALRNALRKAKEITDRANIDANLAYNDALKSGRSSGYEAGLKEGREEGEKTAEQMVVSAAHDFLDTVTSLDEKLYEKLSADREDCIDFAFNLASKILNIDIDRNKSEYKELLSDFMNIQTTLMTLSADGKDYSFETLRPDDILESSRDMAHISLTKNISETNSDDIYNKEENNSQTPISADNLTENNLLADGPDESGPEASVDVTEQVNDTENAYKEADGEPHVGSHENEIRFEESEPEMPEDSYITDEDVDEEQDEPADYYHPEEMVQSEKYVFIRPSVKSVKIPKNDSDNEKFAFSEIKYLSQEILKAVVKKVNIKDLSAALNGADEDIISSLMNAMSNKNREKVLDAIKYLGPIPQPEIDAARKRIAEIAYEMSQKRSRA